MPKHKVTYTIEKEVLKRLGELSAKLTIIEGKYYSKARLVQEALENTYPKEKGKK